MPESMRASLGRPQGKLFPTSEVGGKEFTDTVARHKLVITVGDRTTEALAALGRVPDVQVVDGKEERRVRKPPSVPYESILRASNPPATLTAAVIEAVRLAFSSKKPARVLVDGEEDLVAIPVIALAPESSLVLYGQPGEGMVAVVVDSSSKERNQALMDEFGIPRQAKAGST